MNALIKLKMKKKSPNPFKDRFQEVIDNLCADCDRCTVCGGVVELECYDYYFKEIKE